MDFFSFLMEKNAEIGGFMEELKQRQKVQLSEWVPPQKPALDNQLVKNVQIEIDKLGEEFMRGGNARGSFEVGAGSGVKRGARGLERGSPGGEGEGEAKLSSNLQRIMNL